MVHRKIRILFQSIRVVDRVRLTTCHLGIILVFCCIVVNTAHYNWLVVSLQDDVVNTTPSRKSLWFPVYRGSSRITSEDLYQGYFWAFRRWIRKHRFRCPTRIENFLWFSRLLCMQNDKYFFFSCSLWVYWLLILIPSGQRQVHFVLLFCNLMAFVVLRHLDLEWFQFPSKLKLLFGSTLKWLKLKLWFSMF